MSWKPSRSTGMELDRYMQKDSKYFSLLNEILPKCNPPAFKDINKLSKYYYLYWLNEKRHSKNSLSFLDFCPNYYTNIFNKYPDLIYKPLLKYLKNVQP